MRGDMGCSGGILTSGCTSTMHILFLAWTERMASMLVPYWFSLYSPCSMNLRVEELKVSRRSPACAEKQDKGRTYCSAHLHQTAAW